MKDNDYLSGILYGGGVLLGGASLYLLIDNMKLKKENLKQREEILKLKKEKKLLIGLFKNMHKNYLSLRDELKEHVLAMIEHKNLDLEKWAETPEFLPEGLVGNDLQFFPIEMIMVKITGLVDAYILNKWSIFPDKKLPKSVLSNGKSLDIYDESDMNIVLEKLRINNKITDYDYDLIMDLYYDFKFPVLVDEEIPEKVNIKALKYYFNDTVDMILERS